MEKKFIKIERVFLESLLYDQLFLEELESLGVDNWEGFDDRTITPEERNLEVERLIATLENRI